MNCPSLSTNWLSTKRREYETTGFRFQFMMVVAVKRKIEMAMLRWTLFLVYMYECHDYCSYVHVQ